MESSLVLPRKPFGSTFDSRVTVVLAEVESFSCSSMVRQLRSEAKGLTDCCGCFSIPNELSDLVFDLSKVRLALPYCHNISDCCFALIVTRPTILLCQTLFYHRFYAGNDLPVPVFGVLHHRCPSRLYHRQPMLHVEDKSYSPCSTSRGNVCV